MKAQHTYRCINIRLLLHKCMCTY